MRAPPDTHANARKPPACANCTPGAPPTPAHTHTHAHTRTHTHTHAHTRSFSYCPSSPATQGAMLLALPKHKVSHQAQQACGSGGVRGVTSSSNGHSAGNCPHECARFAHHHRASHAAHRSPPPPPGAAGLQGRPKFCVCCLCSRPAPGSAAGSTAWRPRAGCIQAMRARAAPECARRGGRLCCIRVRRECVWALVGGGAHAQAWVNLPPREGVPLSPKLTATTQLSNAVCVRVCPSVHALQHVGPDVAPRDTFTLVTLINTGGVGWGWGAVGGG
jgi:hypothetical protein